MFSVQHDEAGARGGSWTSASPRGSGIPASPGSRLAFLVLILGILTVLAISRNSIYEEPVSLWKNAVEVGPKKRRTHQNYAHALMMMGTKTNDARYYWQALDEFKVMLGLPDDGSGDKRNFFIDMGLIRYHLGMEEEALLAWREGLEDHPTDAGLKSNLAFALFRLGRLDEAMGFALEARQDDPKLAEGANTLAWIYWERKEYQKAAEQFMQFLELRPEEAIGYWNAAVAFERAGNYLQAREMAVRYLDRETDPEQIATARSFLNDIRK